MSSIVAGSKGFIGSALLRYANKYLENEEWIGINRANSSMWANARQWDKVVWAAGTSSKRLCEEEPDKCTDLNVHQLLRVIQEFPCRKFIYISSSAVYPDGLNKESEVIDLHGITSRYGLTKYLGELVVERTFRDFLIVRPNGFTGVGLKKNAVFDLLANDPPKLYNTWDSKFQFIHVDQFANILFILASSCTREVFNVTSPDVVTLIDVANIHNIDIKAVRMPNKKLERVEAVLDTSKLEAFLRNTDHYIPSSQEAIKNWNKNIIQGKYGTDV